MKIKLLILVLCISIISLFVYSYTVKSELDRQSELIQEQTRTIDSLNRRIEQRESEDILMRAKAEQVIAKTQKEIDSLKLQRRN